MRRRKWLRRLTLSAAGSVLVAWLLWLATAPVIGFAIERQLRLAGAASPSVAGVSLGLSGLTIDRLRLAPAGAFVIDDIRMRIGTSGLRSIDIARLRLEAAAADGRLVLPGFDPAEDGELRLGVLPERGVRLAEAEIRLATAAGPAHVSLTNVRVRETARGAELSAGYAVDHAAALLQGAARAEIASDGALRARLEIARGQIDAASARAAELTGEVVASLPVSGSPAIELELETSGASLAGIPLGGLALEADWRERAARFSVTSTDSRTVDVALDGRADLAQGLASVGLSGRVLLRGTEAQGQLAFDADVAAASGQPPRVSGRIEMTGRDLAFRDAFRQGAVDVAAEGEATFAADTWRISGAGSVNADGEVAAASFEGLAVDWSGTVSGTSGRISVAAGDCVAWSVAALESRGTRLEALSLPPCIRPSDGGALLTYELEERHARFAVSTATAPLEVRLIAAGDEAVIDGTWPALEVSGAIGAAGMETLTAVVSGGALTLADDNLAVRGVEGSVEIRRNALMSSSLTIEAIESRAAPALWTPVSLEATARGQGDGLSFEALISDDLGTLVLEASGRHRDGRGSSRVTLYPVQLISGATEIADLSPRLAEHVADAAGTVEFAGEVAWSPDGLESAGSLSIRDFGATISEIPVTGVNTSVDFEGLLPPATLPEQRMDIEEIIFGVPLRNGVVVYDLDADGRLDIQRLAFDMAGGRVYAEPFTVDSRDLRDTEFVLRAEDVELSQMLALSRIEGLEGTGILAGRVPVGLSGQGLRLGEGSLLAETDGTLRYTPEDVPAFLRGDDLRSRMLREVLTNFEYDELLVTVAGESGEGGEQRLTLSASGANPDFLEGHPIELNLNFRGPLLGAMRSAVDVSGTGGIEQMFEQQERENGETRP